MGPVSRAEAPGTPAPPTDFVRLDNCPLNPAAEPDVDMFMGNWRDAPPRMMHGNLYVRDMLTALQGPESLHLTRKCAVLVKPRQVATVQVMRASRMASPDPAI